jgi:hypothetical protein
VRARLLDVDFIKEVYLSDWLTNPVLVNEKNKDWRICIDYTDLNKTCKKDPFDLSQIDQVVDSTAGCSLLSFLGYYSGCYQIPLKKEDQIKRSFITSFGAFVIQQCHSDSKVQVQHIKEIYNGVCILNSGAMLKRTLTTWS